MVYFVGVMLEVSPGNYHLMISVCKLVCGDSSYVGNSKFSSVLYQASSLLVNTIDQAFPISPEYVWLEAVDLSVKLTSVQEIRESFLQRALSAHPFSINLWKSFFNCSTDASKMRSVVEAAKEKGLELDQHCLTTKMKCIGHWLRICKFCNLHIFGLVRHVEQCIDKNRML